MERPKRPYSLHSRPTVKNKPQDLLRALSRRNGAYRSSAVSTGCTRHDDAVRWCEGRLRNAREKHANITLAEYAARVLEARRTFRPGPGLPWIKEQRIAGIRLNVPTERRDSLLLASLVSAVLAYDDAAQLSSPARAARSAACGKLRTSRSNVARSGETGPAARSGNASFDAGCGAAVSFGRVRQRSVLGFPDRARSLPREAARRGNAGAVSGASGGRVGARIRETGVRCRPRGSASGFTAC